MPVTVCSELSDRVDPRRVGRTGSARARIQRRQLLAVVLVTAVIVPVFNVVTDRPTARAAVQGLVDAVLISMLVGGYLLLIREGVLRGWFRRRSFGVNLVVNSSVALGLFLLGRAVGQVVTTLQPRRLLTSFGDAHLLYALPFFVVVVLAVQFVLQMNRVIGASVLRYFVTGVYHRPREEERIFLFLDLEGSTRLAERLGSAAYFELLRRFVDDLTEPVLDCAGEIYQYAGDEVVITWPHAAGVRRANCVRCFFAIRASIAGRAAVYESEFGVVPRFHAGLHGGTVTAGELGDLRQQIVFVGDILNTAARLEEYAKRTGRDLVVSGTLLDRMVLSAGVEAARCGELELRGKGAPVTAYSLSAAPGIVD
jgi:adenylate cyclase